MEREARPQRFDRGTTVMAISRPSRRLAYGAGVAATAAVLAVVVALPVLGLGEIQSAHEESHNIGTGLRMADAVAREGSALILLTRFVDSSNPSATLARFEQQRVEVLADLVLLERFVTTDAPSLVQQTEGYGGASRVFIREAELLLEHVSKTGNESTAPNRDAYLDARRRGLEKQEELFGAATALIAANDDRATAVIARARWMSFAAAGIAVVLLGACLHVWI